MEQSDSKPQIPQQGTIPSESNLHVAPPPPKNSASASLKTPVVIFKIISVVRKRTPVSIKTYFLRISFDV